MTPMETLFALCRSLETTLEDFRFEDEAGKERPVTVYPFHFPEQVLAVMNPHAEDGYTPVPATQDDTFQQLMPAVVVRPLSYEDKALDDDSSILSMAVTVGVFSRDPANVAGSWGVVNILERIRQAIEAAPILEERCEALLPLSWVLYDEALRPLWFGEMTTQWRILDPHRLDDTNWAGDFLKGDW